MDVAVFLLNTILNVLDVLPDMPPFIVDAIDAFMDLIFQGIHILSFFVPLGWVSGFAVVFILVENFEHIYSLIMWVLRKIPLAGIE